MKEILADILGRKKDTPEHELLEEVRKMKFELDAKMGYVSLSLIEKLKRDGIFRHNEMTQSWFCRMSDEEMRRLTQGV